MGKISQLADRFVRAVCKGAIKHPIIGMFAILTIAFIISALGFVAYPIAIDSSPSTFVPRTSEAGQREETRTVIEEVTRFNPFRNPSDLAAIAVPQQGSVGYGGSLLVSVDIEDNLFTPARVDLLRELETRIRAFTTSEGTSFDDVCLRSRDSGECLPFESLLRYLYATPITGCPGVFEPNGNSTTRPQAIDDALQALIDPALEGVFCYTTSSNCSANCIEPSPTFPLTFTSNTFGYEDNNASLTSTLDLTSHLSVIQLAFGIPLNGFSSIEDRYDEQQSIIEEFVREINDLIADEFEGRHDVRMTLLSAITSEDYFNVIILKDTLLITISIFVVFLYMSFHLQSLFVASMGMFHVLLSFPIAYFFTQLSIDFGGLGVLTLMSLFIILGIGADDIFIFVDAWKQSEHEVLHNGKRRKNAVTKEEEVTEENKEWILDRMVWAYERSSSAMLITSLTTGAAFLMNLASNVPAVQIFGLFTGFMIFFNYILVITYFPFAVIVHQRFIRFLPIPWCLCKNKCSKSDSDGDTSSTAADDKVLSDDDAEKGRRVSEGAADLEIESYRRIERFFHGTYTEFVHKYRWAIMLFFAILFSVAMAFAVQLKASEEPTAWLPSSDKFQIAFDQLNNEIGRSEQAPFITVMYGVDLVDQSGINAYNPADLGTARFRSDFNPSVNGFQEAFIGICERIRNEAPFVHNNEVLCPLEEFRTYVTDELGMGFPVPAADFVPLMANFTRYYEESFGPAPDVSGATSTSEQTPDTRSERSQVSNTIYQAIRFANTDDAQELVYLAIIANTTLGIFNTGDVIEPVFNAWEELIERENDLQANIDATLSNAIQTSTIYVDLELENSLLRAAIVGIAASISIAFAIIAILTRDFWLSTMSIISILGVVATLIGFMVIIGWSLSLIESLCLTILVGLSVDYVIHLAHSYQETTTIVRKEKIRHGLVIMGISVLSAAITTFLSSFILFFSYILFFFKFGLFIAFTIFFSALWAFGFFMALADIVGPKYRYDYFKGIVSLVTGHGWNARVEGKEGADSGPDAKAAELSTFSVNGSGNVGDDDKQAEGNITNISPIASIATV